MSGEETPASPMLVTLTANHADDAGLGQLPAAMLERLKPITLAPLGPEVMGKIAEALIAKSDLPPLLQEGLRGIVKEELDATPMQGARGLHSLIKKHLDKPLTQEWREKMLSMTPAGQVVSSLAKGTSRKVTAPKTAHFRRRAP